MTATARRGTLTIERLRADIEQGILDHDIDTCVPPELFGPPTAAELAAVRRAQRPRRARADGRSTGKRTAAKRAAR